MTSGTSTLGHQPRRICLWALGHAHAHLTEGFMHQARRATDRTALRRRDGRWTTGCIAIVLRRPPLPHPPLLGAVRTEQRSAPGTLTVACPVARGRETLDGALHEAPH